MEKRLSTAKAMISLASLIVLVIAQSAAFLVGDAAMKLGLPASAANLINAVLYAGLTLAGLKLLCDKGLGLSLEDCRITRPRIRPVWAAGAVFMPLLVCCFMMLVPGKWVLRHDFPDGYLISLVTGAVLWTGLAVGIVEEAVFRGVIMTALEKRWNRKAAILAPSMIFGLLHVIGNKLDLLSILQLFVGGTAVGVLFSLVTFESGTIWSSALMHGIWNMVMVGGVLNIGAEADNYAPYNYVLQTDSFLLTGGDFGVETSIISILVYLGFALLAYFLLKRNKETA